MGYVKVVEWRRCWWKRASDGINRRYLPSVPLDASLPSTFFYSVFAGVCHGEAARIHEITCRKFPIRRLGYSYVCSRLYSPVTKRFFWGVRAHTREQSYPIKDRKQKAVWLSSFQRMWGSLTEFIQYFSLWQLIWEIYSGTSCTQILNALAYFELSYVEFAEYIILLKII